MTSFGQLRCEHVENNDASPVHFADGEYFISDGVEMRIYVFATYIKSVTCDPTSIHSSGQVHVQVAEESALLVAQHSPRFFQVLHRRIGSRFLLKALPQVSIGPVSYTHLTLPTKA